MAPKSNFKKHELAQKPSNIIKQMMQDFYSYFSQLLLNNYS